MNKMNKQDYHDWIETKRTLSKRSEDNGMSHAQHMIKKTMEMFGITRTIKECNDQDLLEYLQDFSPDESGCQNWTKGQKFREKYAQGHPRSKESFLRIGKLAKEYFGEDLVRACWKSYKPTQIQEIF